MPGTVPEVQSARQTTAALGECPHCTERVAGFQFDAPSRDGDDIVITLKPCGCTSHSGDDHYNPLVDLVKASESLS
jgi:hypothetical protein